MDGTLTEAVHDLALIRRELQIPPEADILHHLAALPAAQSQAKHAWLLEHERALAEGARAAPGAVALVRALQASGCRLGLLTRNARTLAQVTLQAIGLGDAFAWDDIVGRDEAAPKPAPDGLQYFARRWAVEGSALVMVGDHCNDLACGRAVECLHRPGQHAGRPVARPGRLALARLRAAAGAVAGLASRLAGQAR